MNEDKAKVRALVALLAGLFSLGGGRMPDAAIAEGRKFAEEADKAGLLDGLGLEDVLP